MADWQELWDQHALLELGRMEETPIALLLEEVRRGQYGGYYGIWRVISERATLAEAGWTLLGVLERETDDLCRYHCAAALLCLLGESGVRAADLCTGSQGMPGHLNMLREELLRRVGIRQEEGSGTC